jgi:PPOX class probable F420-dependent enzyme
MSKESKMEIDTSSEFGQRVLRRLQEELIVWLTTLDEEDTPQPRPEWFIWEKGEFILYSRPNTHKLRHIAKRPKVALNFDGNGRGGDIVVFTGEATIVEDGLPADQLLAYVEKYAPLFPQIRSTAEEFARNYSVQLRVRATRLRGH